MPDPIRILVADDHTLVRKGLCTLINGEAGMAVVGEAGDGEEAVQQARLLQPDIILLDMLMPRKDGLEAIQAILSENPNVRILVVTSFSDDEHVFPAIKAGALGYLLKDASPQQLLQAILDVYRGQAALHPSIALKLVHAVNQPAARSRTPLADALTEKERLILKLVAQGLGNQEIAAGLTLSERTVGNHIGSILSKLHLANRTQAALYALREGLAHLDGDEQDALPLE
jgi:two-component system, NarL family, response regulator LiaR